MKLAFPLLMVTGILVGLAGCRGAGGLMSPHGRCLIDGSCGHCTDCPETCQSCDGDNCAACEEGGYIDDNCEAEGPQECGLRDRVCRRPEIAPGPPTGAIAYPYYTTRGPRDFLARNPQSIGP